MICGLRQCSDITIWFTEGYSRISPAKTGSRGRPQEYSDIAIETVLFIRQVFYLLLCQTEGFMNSLARVMKAGITIPDQHYSWDITYLASIILGQFFCLYLFLDIFRRKSWAGRCMKRKTAPWQAKWYVTYVSWKYIILKKCLTDFIVRILCCPPNSYKNIAL